MPEPAGDAAARSRVAALLDRLTHVNVNVVVVAPPDAERIAARDQARDAAIASGRGGLLAEATAAAREVAQRAFAQGGFSGTWAVSDWSISVASAQDRFAAAEAYEEAATAAVAEDLIDDDTVQILRVSLDHLSAMGRLPAAGSLSALTSSAVGRRGPVGVVVGLLVVALVGLLWAGPALAVIVAVAGVGLIAILDRRDAAS
jgi:hypothetical protein